MLEYKIRPTADGKGFVASYRDDPSSGSCPVETFEDAVRWLRKTYRAIHGEPRNA